jgi:hypothetical protein
MTNSVWRIIVIAAGVLTLACGEGIGPPSIVEDLDVVVPRLDGARDEIKVTTVVRDRDRSPGISAIVQPIDGSSSTLPPEWQQAPTIYTRWTDAGFGTNAAWGQGFMHYFASHATQTVRLALRFNNSTVATTSGTSEHSSFFPWFRDLWTNASLSVGKSCGHAADASTQHTAWHQPPAPLGGLAKWGMESAPSYKPATQSSCPREIKRDTVAQTEPGPGAGGPSAGGGWYTCYYYYEYYTDTGEIVYSAFLGCAGKGGE